MTSKVGKVYAFLAPLRGALGLKLKAQCFVSSKKLG